MKGDGNHRLPPLCSQANYTFAQPGIQRMVFHLREIVNRVDPALYKHVNSSPVAYSPYNEYGPYAWPR